MRFIELFAGVGGFRVGLSNASKKFNCVWANQWEPSTKIQHAANVYRYHFEDKDLSNIDINDVIKENHPIPNHDLLTAGFPCQDFSVAHTVAWSKGLEGIKGNLWFSILEVIDRKKPTYCLFENVNRLLLSPALRRGRDFAYILSTLNERNYAVEWMVVDASEYGFPQRRKRVFFMCYKKGSKNYKNPTIIKQAFPFISDDKKNKGKINKPNNVFKKFNLPKEDIKSAYKYNSPKPFCSYGICIDKKYETYNFTPNYSGKYSLLGDVIVKDVVPKEYYVSSKALKAWKKEKGGYTKTRTTKDGFTYDISSGKMDLYDRLDEPSRTIITGEGGNYVSRMKHLIETDWRWRNIKSRRLVPLELEHLNMFPNNFTEIGLNENGEEYIIPDARRAFLMGNALVTGCVENIGKALIKK